MTENQYDKKIEDRGESLFDITNEYIENESPKNESVNVLNMVVEKLKSRTKALTKKIKDNDKDLNIEFNMKKSKEICIQKV